MEQERLKIKEYNHWTLFLHENQTYLGRCYVWAKKERDADIMEMTEEELKEFFQIGSKVKEAITALFSPERFNYANFQNIVHKLHVHIIPRYSEHRTFDNVTFVDDNWGHNYSPYDKEFKLPESTLSKIRDAIRKEL